MDPNDPGAEDERGAAPEVEAQSEEPCLDNQRNRS